MNKKLIALSVAFTYLLCGCSSANKTENTINDNETTINQTDNTKIEEISNEEEISIPEEFKQPFYNLREEEQLYYLVSSEYGIDENPSYFEMFDSENSLERQKNFNNELKNNFDYLEIHTQFLEHYGYYNGDKKFVEDRYEINEKIDENTVLTKLKNIMIGKTAYHYLDNYIEEGRNFTDEDFQVNNPNQEINVILGQDYKEVYKIGDTFSASLHKKTLNFKVVGFLKKDAKFFTSMDYDLSQRIIMPFYDINYEPTDEEDKFYQNIYYSQKNSGLIKITEDIKKVEIEKLYMKYSKNIKELANKYDLLYSVPVLPTIVKF